MESRVALARILWLFDVKVDGHLPTTYEIEDHFTAQKQGPIVRFKRRKPVEMKMHTLPIGS